MIKLDKNKAGFFIPVYSKTLNLTKLVGGRNHSLWNCLFGFTFQFNCISLKKKKETAVRKLNKQTNKHPHPLKKITTTNKQKNDIQFNKLQTHIVELF